MVAGAGVSRDESSVGAETQRRIAAAAHRIASKRKRRVRAALARRWRIVRLSVGVKQGNMRNDKWQ
jgi:hypothetical protein